VCRYFARNYTKKYGVPEILIQIGSQYTSEVYTNVLLNNGISMDGKGRDIDNIF
jgi:hypothetical protein